MNDYLVLDGYRYATVFGQWRKVPAKPAKVSYTLGGETSVTYGVARPVAYEGKMKVPVDNGGDSDYGTIDEFRVTAALGAPVTLVDHEGNSMSVHVLAAGGFAEDPKLPVLDSIENVFYVSVRLVVA